MKKLITEAALNLPEGVSILAWLRDLEAGAIKAVAAVLPTAAVDDRGRFPEQWLRMVDATVEPPEVLVCASRYSRCDDTYEAHFRVPFAANEAGVLFSDPVEVSVEMRMVVTDVPPGMSTMSMADQISEALVGLRARTETAITLAESLLSQVSGKHPLAPMLAVELSRARA